MRNIRGALSNEAGASLPEALVAIIVSLIGLTVMAYSLHTFTATEEAFAASGHSNTQLSITDSTFRSDAEWAVSVVGESTQTVGFISPTSTGGCKSDTWTMNPSNSTSRPSPVTLTTTITSSMAVDRSSCTGSTVSGNTQTMLDDAGPQAQFTFVTVGGRQASFVGGTETLDGAAAQPSTIDDNTWASTAVSKVVLNGSLNPSAANPKPVRISQILLQTPRSGQAPTGSAASS